MSSITVSLLKAASEVVGGSEPLAQRLGISETLLSKFMDDVIELPDQLLLHAVDIVLEDRQSRLSLAILPAAENPQSARG